MGKKLDQLNEGIHIGGQILSDVKWAMTPGWKKQIVVREHAEKTKQQLAYYCEQLEKQEQVFRMKARQMELRGSHSAAMTAARYVLTLRNMRDRADGMMMRFEMMQSLKDMKVAQLDFVKNCVRMGKLMDPRINPASWVSNTETLRGAMAALDEMDGMTAEMFGVIDHEVPFGQDVSDQDAEDLIGDIIHVYGTEQYMPVAEPVVVEPVAEQPVPEVKEQPKVDPEVERMLQQLKNRASGR